MKKCLKCAVFAAFFGVLASAQGAVYWSSGTIRKPDDTIAGAGDVTMYALVTMGIQYGKMAGIDLYSQIKSGKTYDQFLRQYDAALLIDVCDSNGRAEVTLGLDNSTGYENEMAVALFVCDYDGSEWYMQVYGDHYATAPWPQFTNDNMASRGTWVRGDPLQATPEPSSAVLIIIGSAAILLRRRARGHGISASHTHRPNC